jgi:chromosome segregation ATPase
LPSGVGFVSEDIIWEQFKTLEEKVSQLIKVCQTLEEEKAKLAAQLAETEKIANEKDSENKRLIEERMTIRGKIDNVLLKLEDVPSASNY